MQGDSTGLISLSKNPEFHQLTKHIKIREHFTLRDMAYMVQDQLNPRKFYLEQIHEFDSLREQPLDYVY